jgi:hypothetical protein
MTANELADAIEKGGKDGFFQDEIIAILRQQQAELDALRLRELTDAEILEVCSQIEPFDDITIEQAFIHFARAILKKAREK